MIELFTAPTPNGYKVSIALEEMGLPYTVRVVQFGKLEQQEPWFLELNPNGRIPVIVDHGNEDFVVFESAAILLYLAEKSGMLWPEEAKARSVAMQWLMFQMSGVGPMMGQANVFNRYAPEKIPFAIERYQREVRRLFEVLDRRLQAVDFLAGDYTISDIATFSWVRTHNWSGVDVAGLDALQRWLGVIAARPAVARGLNVPPRPEVSKETFVEGARKILA